MKMSSDGLSRFEKAQKLFQDIESIIEQELANTPIMAANYETNIARIKKSKRKRPGLIRNFNSKKNRQVIGGMEYDPDTMTWLGNDDVLSAFSPLQPALIINRGRHDKAKVVGKMIWDPKERKWKGNEKDALKFSPRKPGLITPLGINYTQKEVSGMVFDPVAMRWVGNDSVADIFSQIDTLDDVGFTVGNEFHLSPTLTKSFVECANRHKAALSGWFGENTMDRKAHLYAIRNMSILRVVRDVKQRRIAVDLDDDIDMNVPERDVPSPRDILASKNSGNGNNTDAEDYDDLPITPSTKLKFASSVVAASPAADDDWDKDFDDESTPAPPPSSSGKEDNKPNVIPAQAQSLNKKPVVAEAEDDWDSDFAEPDGDTLNKLKMAIISKSKPFQETRSGSSVDLRERSKNNMHTIKPSNIKLPVVEEDEEGLELPPGGTLQLTPTLKHSLGGVAGGGDSGTDSGFDDMDSTSTESASNYQATSDQHGGDTDGSEEEEEDWTDVDVPTSFPAQPILKPHQDREDWDNDADFGDFTAKKLTLKKRVKSSDDEEDDLMSGVDIPENFADRLKK